MVTTDFEIGIGNPDHLSTTKVRTRENQRNGGAIDKRWPRSRNLHTQGEHAFQVVTGEDAKGNKGL